MTRQEMLERLNRLWRVTFMSADDKEAIRKAIRILSGKGKR